MKKTLTFLLLQLLALQSVSQGTWTQKANFPNNGKQLAVGFSIGNYGYVGLGYEAFQLAKDFARFDPSTNTWSLIANFTGNARWGASSFVIGNRAYVFCGFSNYTFYSDNWMYDPSLNTWTSKATFPGGARWHGTGFSIGNKGYYGFGSNTSTGKHYSDLWEYDPSLNTWTQKASCPGGTRYYVTSFAIGGKAYVVCGTGTVSGCNSDVWEYDPTTNIWLQKASYPGTTCESLTSFTIGNFGYAGLGKTAGNGSVTSEFFKYDPSSDTWTAITFLPATSNRWLSTGFSIGTKGYVATGNQNCPSPQCDLNDLWEYSLSTVGLHENNSQDLTLQPNPADDHFSVATGNGKFTAIRIHDMSGRLVLQQAISDDTAISTSSMNNGIYLVTLSGNDNIAVKKLVVAR